MRLSVSKTRLFLLAFLLAFLSSSVPILAVQKSAFMRVYDLKAGHSKRVLAGNNPVNLTDPSGLDPSGGTFTEADIDYYRGVYEEAEYQDWRNRQPHTAPNVHKGEHLDPGYAGDFVPIMNDLIFGGKGLGILGKARAVRNARCADALLSAKPAGTALKKGDKYHRSASFMREEAAQKGTHFSIVGGDGQRRTLTQLPGELNGEFGRFEFIVDGAGDLTHQMFVRGGSINGKAIKP